jgi:hypothetical protein
MEVSMSRLTLEAASAARSAEVLVPIERAINVFLYFSPCQAK